MSRHEDPPDHRRRHADDLLGDCPQMTAFTSRIREFACLLTERRGQDLPAWMDAVAADDLPARIGRTSAARPAL
jgi:hypothetical protein